MERGRVVDQRRHAFFTVDNVVILEYAERIGSNALALYVILACHARTDSGDSYPSVKRLMRLMGRSRPVVFAAIEVLKAHKLLRVEQRRAENGGLTSSLYTLLPVENPVVPIDERPVQIADQVVSIIDEGSADSLPGVGKDVDYPGLIDLPPLVNIVDSELDEVLNQTILNQKNLNKTNLRGIAPSAQEAHAPIRTMRYSLERPSEEEAAEFFRASGSTTMEAGRYWNFYESKGWLVGKAPMRDWRAAARNWMARSREEATRREGGRGSREASGSSLAEMSARNEARLEAMRERGALRDV